MDKKKSLNFEYLLLRGNVWSESLEHCISIDFLLQYGGEDVKNALTFTHSHLTQPDIERLGNFYISRKYTIILSNKVNPVCLDIFKVFFYN